MIIKYKNNNKEIITKQQALQLDEYYKSYYNDNILIKEETHYGGNLHSVSHHNINNESHQTMLNDLYISIDFGFSIVDHTTYPNQYKLEKTSIYKNENGALAGRTTNMFDPNGELVGSETFNDSEVIPQFSNTLKYYYDRSINPFTHLFEVKYNKDTGAFWHFIFNQEHTDPFGQDSFVLLNTPEDIQRLINITGMSQELINYYLVASVEPTW